MNQDEMYALFVSSISKGVILLRRGVWVRLDLYE